jgi:hypothetical protein
VRERLEAWAERSGLNPLRLLRMPWPRVPAEDAGAFDALLDATAPGGWVDYDLPPPKWVFLHHLVRRGFLLHGSNVGDIEEFRTRQTFDAYQEPIDAVFASDDAIWPLYFAVVRRDGNTYGYINWCVHVGAESRYIFSIGRDAGADDAWTDGTIYVLPGDTFTRTRDSRELTSLVPVRPRARLRVEPHDFPFRSRTLEHGRGDTPQTVVYRNALSPWRRPRSRARRRRRAAAS